MGHILLFTSKMTVYHVKKILHFLHTYTVVCQIPQFTKTWFNGEIMKKKRKKREKESEIIKGVRMMVRIRMSTC